jgi:hypothetical protein
LAIGKRCDMKFWEGKRGVGMTKNKIEGGEKNGENVALGGFCRDVGETGGDGCIWNSGFCVYGCVGFISCSRYSLYSCGA